MDISGSLVGIISFLFAAIKNYHKIGCLKPHRFIIRFCRLGIQHESHWA